MNKTQFGDILKQPESLNKDTLRGIKEIIDEYPFFQIGRMLWLKNLHKLDNIKYNSELKNSAAYIPDRSKLFQLINAIGQTVSETKQAETVENKMIPEVVEHDSSKEAEEHSKDKQSSLTLTDNYLNASDDFSDDDGTIYNFAAKQKVPAEEKNEVQDIVLPAADLLDYEMSSSSGYTLPSIEEVKDVHSEDNRSFSDWLHIMHYSSPPKKTEEPERKNKGMELIDNFLNSNPQIVPDPAKKPKEVDLPRKAPTHRMTF